MDEKAPGSDPGGGIPHPIAVKAKELQEAVNRLKEQVRDALAKRLNPELIDDLNWSIARFNGQINDLFRSGE
jgi:hypothetical protein